MYSGKVLHNEERYSLYYQPNVLVIRVTNCRRLKLAGYVARMKDGRNV